MKRLNHVRLFLGILFLALSGFHCKAQEVTKSFSGITKIEVNTHSGHCKLVKASDSDVKVTISFTYSSNEYRPSMEKRGGTLYLKEDFNGSGSFSGNSTWTLAIPENLSVKFSTGSGSFEVNNITVDVTVNSGSGDFESEDVQGNSKINTGSGAITIRNSKGTVDAGTGSGNVRFTNLNGEISARAGSGNIEMQNLKGSIMATTGSGDIDASAIELTSKGTFSTGSGDATVGLIKSPESNISVASGSGNAILDFNNAKIEGTVILTANKKNGEITAPFPFDKTEELNDSNNDQVRIRKTAKLGSREVEVKVSTGSGKAEIKN